MRVRTLGCRHRSAAFSLFELLVTVGLAAMLTLLALPAWQNQLRSVRRADAVLSLAHLATWQTQFFSAHARYAEAAELSAAGLDESRDGHYRISTAAHPTGFLISAIARSSGAQANDLQCRVFTLDAAGRRSAQSSAGQDATAHCW